MLQYGQINYPVLVFRKAIIQKQALLFSTPIYRNNKHVGNTSDNCYNTKLDVDYTQWHVYGFEWTAAGFTGYIDGKQVYTTDGAGSNAAKPFHQTIQLDNLSGQTPASPGKMEVDYVHLYKKG